MTETRYVKLGRWVVHWAVQVENTWYEVGGTEAEGKKEKINKIVKHCGWKALSGAGLMGGEYVGKTDKTDEEIDEFNRKWISNNPTYDVFTTNCQKFAIELIRFQIKRKISKNIL